MDAYGIVKICRFRDDVLVLASERLKSHDYGRGMINRTFYFTTKCEKISHDQIEYLDCEVWIENGTIPSGPLKEPTSLGVPLQDTSCHPVHIHTSWPVSVVPRHGDLSTSHRYAEKACYAERAKDIFVERFVKHLPHHTSPTVYEQQVQATRGHR